MSPGFFGFYAHIGALVALEAAGLLEKVGGLVHVYQIPLYPDKDCLGLIVKARAVLKIPDRVVYLPEP